MLQVFLVYGDATAALPRQDMALVQQGNSKGTQLQGVVGLQLCNTAAYAHPYMHDNSSVPQHTALAESHRTTQHHWSLSD